MITASNKDQTNVKYITQNPNSQIIATGGTAEAASKLIEISNKS